MTSIRKFGMFLAMTGLLLGVNIAPANNEVEGEVEAVNAEEQAFTVQGIEFFTNDRTDYDDGLERFEDIEVGQRVEVDFEYRDGRQVATEVELDK